MYICGVKKFHHVTSKFITKNGFNVLNIEIANYPISTTSVWINAGSKEDSIENQGLSHLFEHLLFTKTEKYPNRQQRLEIVESNGFYYNALTTLQYQHYFYVHTFKKSKLALEMLCDGVFSTSVDQEMLDVEKKVVIAEESENRQDPSSYVWTLSNKGLWGTHSLGKDLYGNSKTVTSINLSDFKTFQSQNFHPENMCFVFINTALSRDDQEKIIGGFSSKIFIDNKHSKPPKKVNKSFEKLTFEERDQESHQLAISFLTKSMTDEKQRAIAELVASYLSSGWTSKFVQKLRVENSLLYWVYPEVALLDTAGYIRFYLSVLPKNLKETLKTISQEINKIKKGEIEIQSHISKFLGELERNTIDFSWLMQWYGHSYLSLKKPHNLNEFYECISATTNQEIISFVKEYFITEKLNITCIGKNLKPSSFSTFQLQ